MKNFDPMFAVVYCNIENKLACYVTLFLLFQLIKVCFMKFNIGSRVVESMFVALVASVS